MIYVNIAVALLLLTIIYMRAEASMLSTNHVRFSKGSKQLKIAHLSDIHIPMLKVSTVKIRRVIEKEQPDIIIMTGDYIEKPADVESFINFILQIKSDAPIFACLGNHDYKAFLNDNRGLEGFITALENEGIKVLHNDSVPFEHHGRMYNIVGIADMRDGYSDVKKAFSKLSPSAFATIAFTHNPDIVLEIPRGKADFLFCGHFHGGQIWAPFNFEFRLLRDEKLCRMGVKRGLHKVNGINLYISRGLGNVIVPLRLFSKPEITIYHMP